MINLTKASNLYLVEKVSKKGRTYYALILKIQDVEIFLNYVKKADFDFIKSISSNN